VGVLEDFCSEFIGDREFWDYVPDFLLDLFVAEELEKKLKVVVELLFDLRGLVLSEFYEEFWAFYVELSEGFEVIFWLNHLLGLKIGKNVKSMELDGKLLW